MSEFNISEWVDEEENEQKHKVQSSSKNLFILAGTLLCGFDGKNWSYYPLIDQEKACEQIRSLKCPNIIEIPPKDKETLKTFFVTGGFDSIQKSTSKLCLTINKHENKEEEDFYFSLNFGFADMISPRYLHKTINIDDKFFLAIAGKNNNGWINDCEIYNLTNKKWENFDKLNNKRSNFDSIYINKKVFVFGGFEDSNKFCQNVIEMCDFSKEIISGIKWKVIDVKVPVFACSRIIKSNENSKLLIVGGCDQNQLKNEIYQFNVDTFEFSQVSKLKYPRANYHVLIENDSFYLVGGTFKSEIEIKNNNVVFVSNYIEKINLKNFNSEIIPFDKDLFLASISENVGKDVTIYQVETGLPYSTSLESN